MSWAPASVGATLRVVRASQANAEAFLQAANGMAERRPRDSQPSGRLREAAFFSNGEEYREDVQVVQLHW